MKLAHFSDLHYDGTPTRLEAFERALASVSAHSADHLLIAGDLVDYADPRHLADMKRVLQGSPWWDPARLTILPGNHDLYRHSYPNLFRSIAGGFPGLAGTTRYFEELFGAFMGAPIASASLPSLKPLSSQWQMLLLDTLVKTHRFDFMGSWRGWLDPALSEPTLAALAEASPTFLVVACHHFPLPESAPNILKGTSFFEDSFRELLELLEGLVPTPRIYLCGHIHNWEPGFPDAFDTEVVAGVSVYCQGRTGGMHGAKPSWTLHELSDEGAIDSQLIEL